MGMTRPGDWRISTPSASSGWPCSSDPRLAFQEWGTGEHDHDTKGSWNSRDATYGASRDFVELAGMFLEDAPG